MNTVLQSTSADHLPPKPPALGYAGPWAFREYSDRSTRIPSHIDRAAGHCAGGRVAVGLHEYFSVIRNHLEFHAHFEEAEATINMIRGFAVVSPAVSTDPLEECP